MVLLPNKEVMERRSVVEPFLKLGLMEMFDLFFISFFQLYFMSQQCNYIHCPLSMQVWLLLLVMKCKPTGRGPCLDFGCVPSKAIKNTSIIKLCAFTLCRASVLIEKNNQDVTANFF